MCMINSVNSDQLLYLHCSNDGKVTYAVLKVKRRQISGIDTIKYHTSPETSYLNYVTKTRKHYTQETNKSKYNAPVTCIPRPSRSGNSEAFSFSIFNALLKALNCGAKYVLKSQLNTPRPTGCTPFGLYWHIHSWMFRCAV